MKAEGQKWKSAKVDDGQQTESEGIVVKYWQKEGNVRKTRKMKIDTEGVERTGTPKDWVGRRKDENTGEKKEGGTRQERHSKVKNTPTRKDMQLPHVNAITQKQTNE